jgi:hypothetical protein
LYFIKIMEGNISNNKNFLRQRPVWQNPETATSSLSSPVQSQEFTNLKITTFEELREIVKKLPYSILGSAVSVDIETLRKNEILTIPEQNNEFIITYVSFVEGRFYLVTINSSYREVDENGNYYGNTPTIISSLISKDSFLEIVSFNGLKNLKLQKFQQLFDSVNL